MTTIILSSLFGYTGRFQTVMVLSRLFAAAVAVINISAFVCVYHVAEAIVKSMGNFDALDKNGRAGFDVSLRQLGKTY